MYSVVCALLIRGMSFNEFLMVRRVRQSHDPDIGPNNVHAYMHMDFVKEVGKHFDKNIPTES